jgi:7-carboxy-7-deazaguanine synthase
LFNELNQRQETRTETSCDARVGDLTVTEIYRSVQGESSYVGLPCTFIRLTGCPLRCRWCDTSYGFHGGQVRSLDQVLTEVGALDVKLVELTGGEPLAQDSAFGLIDRLIADGYQVLIETGGSVSIERVHKHAHIIMDIKCPDSAMSEHNLWSNLAHLKSSDEIKFVVASKADFDWAVSTITTHRLDERFQLLVSPAFGLVKPADLVQWLLESGVIMRLNLQLHKFIWHPRAKGV